jgi:hypothetical protein
MTILIIPVCETDADYDDWVASYRNRDEVAADYAALIRAHGSAWEEWRPLNNAIIRRWSLAGLVYIKTQAWKRADYLS